MNPIEALQAHSKWLMRAAEEIRAEGHVGWGNTCEQAAQAITALGDGVVVPREPTPAMLKAGFHEAHINQSASSTIDIAAIYRAMISAATPPESEMVECPRCKGLGHVPLEFSDDVCGRCMGMGKTAAHTYKNLT